MNVLHVCANPKPTEESASKQLAVAFIQKVVELRPDVEISNVDLYQDPPPYLSYAAYRGQWFPIFIDGYQATDEELKDMEYGSRQSKVFNEADVLVLTMPMWNYGMPAIMKAWLDQVIAPGMSFRYEGKEVRPLHRIRKVVLLVSSGDTFTEDDPRDALTAQVRSALGFIGIPQEIFSIAWADGQYPMLFPDCDQRKAMAIEAAQELAEDACEIP